MLRIKGAKIAATILLKSRTFKSLALCAVCCLASSSAFALIHHAAVTVSETNVRAGGVVNVTVSATGCTPSNATQTAGEITVNVLNQTGKADLAIQFYDARGLLLRDVVIKQGESGWSESFDLGAGSYTLVADHNPEWLCRITLQ